MLCGRLLTITKIPLLNLRAYSPNSIFRSNGVSPPILNPQKLGGDLNVTRKTTNHYLNILNFAGRWLRI
jgi:hypothetical protein